MDKVDGTFEVSLSVAPESADAFTDAVAAALDEIEGASGPMTTADRRSGAVTVSFEIDSSGNHAADVSRAFDILNSALQRVQESTAPNGVELKRQSLALV